MYRPTVRYSDIYKTYVDEIFHATRLDRNQIIRCALFTAAHNPLFLTLINTFKKSDVPLPDYGHGNLPPLPSFMPVFDEGFTTMCQRPYQYPPQIYYL